MFLVLAFAVCFAGGLVPMVNADAYMLAAMPGRLLRSVVLVLAPRVILGGLS
jgi:hypothetical protein